MVSAVKVCSLTASAPGLCCRLDDIERAIERLIVVARHLGNDERA